MAFKKTLAFKQHLYVQVHGGTGTPYALRLQLRKLATLLALTGAAFIASFAGTLLFFRELEINRRLQERLLEWETHDKLAQVLGAASRAVATTPSGNSPAAPAAPVLGAPKPVPAAPAKKDRRSSADAEAATAAIEEPATPIVASPTALPATAPSTVSARIGDLSAECAGEDCSVHLSMIPNAPGTAQGNLLLVLETEVPRIGTGNPTTQVRKRFYLYPGDQQLDALDPDSLGTQAMKAFRFSRALTTQASFRIGKLLRPLAINVYLFGNDHTLLHHERKTIENEE